MTINLDWRKDDGIFVPMINDTGRNQFFKAAIESSVRGKKVVDIGAGTGFQTVLAVKAGAEHVWAVEQDADRARLTEENIRLCGLSDRVTVIHDNFLNTNLPADYYVSETVCSHLWNEGMLEISEHAIRNGGQFIPGSFEYWFEVYENHPLFAVCSTDSEAHSFQPDIEIDPTFESIISNHVNDANIRYRANKISGLFKQLPLMPEIKFNKLYETPHWVVDLNQPGGREYTRFQHRIEPTDLPDPGNAVYGYCVVLNWRAKHNDIIMNQWDTWFATPSKVINEFPKDGIDIHYNTRSKIWYFKY
jgi:hypothetical protein